MTVPASSLQKQIAENGNQVRRGQRMIADRSVASALQHALAVHEAPGKAVDKAAEHGPEDEAYDSAVYYQKYCGFQS